MAEAFRQRTAVMTVVVAVTLVDATTVVDVMTDAIREVVMIVAVDVVEIADVDNFTSCSPLQTCHSFPPPLDAKHEAQYLSGTCP